MTNVIPFPAAAVVPLCDRRRWAEIATDETETLAMRAINADKLIRHATNPNTKATWTKYRAHLDAMARADRAEGGAA